MTAEQYKIDRKIKIIELYGSYPIENISFIGIDRSLISTGIAVVRQGKLIEQMEFKTKVYEEERLVAIGKKILQIYNKELAGKFYPLICMESYSYGSKFGKFFELGELGGIIKTFLHMKNYYFLEATPSMIKKYATGKGNTPKNLIPMYVMRKFNEVSVGGDAADAIICSFLAANAFANKKGLGKYTQVEKDVFETFMSGKKKSKAKSAKTKNRQLGLEIEE